MAEETKTRAPRFTGSLDLSAAVDAAPVKKDSGIDLSEYTSLLSQSWNKVQAKSPTPGFALVVPQDGVTALKSRFRVAAKDMSLGVAFNESEANEDGNVRVVVQARAKKAAPKAKEATDEAAKPSTGLPKPKGGK